MHKLIQDTIYASFWHDFAYWQGWDFIRARAIVWVMAIILILIVLRRKQKCGCGFWIGCDHHNRQFADRDEELRRVGR